MQSSSPLAQPSRPGSVIASILRSPDQGFRYSAADGIWLSESKSAFVYEPWLALPSREELRDSLKEGVATSLDRYAKNPDARQYVRDNIYDPARAGWQAVCPVRRDSVVLDFGCGLGALSRSIARNCGTVLGADACYERLMVNNAVNQELAYRNVELLCADHTVLREMKDACLDGVVLNGVLEWVPEMAPGPPREVQMHFLQECRRILKPDGWLYLGIENRWGYRYFMDRRDEHVDLMYSTLLPRFLADVYCRIAKKKPYRTYTYGPRGYRALLKDAGFPASTVYAVLPDYRSFSELRPLENAKRVSGAGRCLYIEKPWKQRVVEAPGFFRRFVPSLGVVGHTSVTPSPPAWLGDFGPRGCSLEKVYVKHDQASFWYRTSAGESRIRELALASTARDKLRRVARLASALGKDEDLARALGDWQLHDRNGALWADRRVVEGLALSDVPAATRDARMDSVCGTIRRLHSLAARLDWPVDGLADICTEYTSPSPDVSGAYWWDELKEVVSILDRRAAGPSLLMHGDCTASNILLADAVALIDWEWSRVVNFAGYDILKLLWFEDEDPRCPTRFWNEETLHERLKDERARRYFKLVHPAADWDTGVLVYWCVRTARELGAAADRGWRADFVRAKLEPSVAAVRRAVNA